MCVSPKLAWPDSKTGRFVFYQDSRRELGAEKSVPCGQCIECRIRHGQTWVARCLAELREHPASCFTTLTYAPENRPATRDEWRRDVTLYLKRMQEHFGPGHRYFGCMERGDMNGAPHAHMIEFGHDYSEDREPVRSHKGNTLYRSALLERLWPHGWVEVGEANADSIGYVARYTLKKLSGLSSRPVLVDGAPHWVQPSGELDPLPLAELFCSRRPAVGVSFVQKFGRDLIGGHRTHGGRRMPTPRAWLRWAKKHDPELFEAIQSAAEVAIKRNLEEETPERGAVRAEVIEARLALKGRRL